MSIATPEVDIEEKIKETVLEPKRYNVIFLNDDVTPMDFVVEMLVGIFKHSEKTAQEITMTIHILMKLQSKKQWKQPRIPENMASLYKWQLK
jgi:ATP-dependent Clp protease adapter protein ClpS